jgi:hypothetical protein
MQATACPPRLPHLITIRMVFNHHMHMHIIYIALRIIWYIKYYMGQAHNIFNNPHQILGYAINNV